MLKLIEICAQNTHCLAHRKLKPTVYSICFSYWFQSRSSEPSSKSTWVNQSAWPFKTRPIACPEMSVTNYQSTLPNNLEEQNSHLHRDGSWKSCS